MSASPSCSRRLLEQLKDLRLHHHVERRGGLVGDHQRRMAGERQGDHHPLALPAGELVRVAMPEARREPDRGQELADPVAHLLRAGALVQPDRLGDLGIDALHRVERVHRPLEDQRDVAPAHEPHARLGALADVDRLVRVRGTQRHASRTASGSAAAASSAPARWWSCRSRTRPPAPAPRPARARSRRRRRSARLPCSTRRSLTSSSGAHARCSRSRGFTCSSNR